MPVPSKENDSRVMANLQCTFTRRGAKLSEIDAARAALSFSEFAISESELGEEGALQGSYDRWSVLQQIARGQSFEVLHAEHLHLQLLGIAPEEIAEAIVRSKTIGRQFGLLSTFAGQGKLTDNEAIEAMQKNPAVWFAYDSSQRQLDFSVAVKERMQDAYAKGLGCSALRLTVEVDGQKTNVFDAYWDLFAHNYATEYVLKGGEYTPLTVHLPEIY